MHAIDTVTSLDRTAIGYRRLGDGPGLILLHGGMMASQSFIKLGEALSDCFTVFIPDRRGRGMSGPFGGDYGIARECEDVRALVEKTGACDIFGLSSGAIIALRAALTVPEIRRVAAYEPPFSIDGFDAAHWAPRFDDQVAQGKLAAAMLTVMRGTGDSAVLKLIPDFLLVPFLNVALRADARTVKAGDVPIRDLVPTMHFDARIVREASSSVSALGALHAEVLLMGGGASPAFFARMLDTVAKVLPTSERIALPGQDHLAADNDGKPELVAAALRRFFGRAPRASLSQCANSLA